MILSSSESRLRYLYALCVTLVLVWANFSYFHSTPYFILALSNCLVILGVAPFFLWLSNEQRESIPLLPMHSFFYAITFGIAGFHRFEKSNFEGWHFEIQNNIFGYALICVIVGLLSLYFAYYVVAPKMLERVEKVSIFSFGIKDEKAYILLAWIGFPGSCLLYWLSQQSAVVYLRPSFQIAYQFIFYLLMAAYFKGCLNKITKAVLLILILPYQFFIGSLFFEGSIGILIINIVAIAVIFFAIRQRVPWGWMALIILVILLIQPIKADLRNRIWQLSESGTSLQLKSGTTLVDSFGALISVVRNRYISGGSIGTYMLRDAFKESYVRMNRLSTLVEVIERTPNPQPYRYGSTYTPLLTKWIPRIIWQDKPREILGNEWVRTYGLTSPYDYAYSYNLPWIAEMYMNFGFLGVLGVSFLIGLLFYVFKVSICQSGSDPFKLAFGVILLVPLMFPESHLSLVMGGVITQSIALLILWLSVSKVAPHLFYAGPNFKK